jgi:UDP-N-acetylglucosamine--dolichyl-phosphate N-acetylglucosaminephosphotransferase
MILVSAFIGLLLSLTLTPYIANLMKKAGIVGRDIHKREKPEVAEMGGLAILISLSLASILIKDYFIARALIVFLLFGLIGILDDLTKLRQLHKVLLSLIVSLPIVSMHFDGELNLILFSFNLGILYYLFAILFITGSANLINLLAGFNGLEVGTSAIALFFLSLIAEGSAKSLALVGFFVCLGFLWWNKYPAKVFPGDTGTLSLGALIGLIGIIGKVEIFAAILLIPHAIDFLLKTKIRFKGRPLGKTEVLKDGTLKAPPYLSFLGLIMRIKKVKEWELVAIVWMIEFLLGLGAFLLHQLL